MTTAAELKQVRDELMGLVNDFQSKNDERTGEIENSVTKVADAVTTEVTEKMNAAITELTDKYDAMLEEYETRANDAERRLETLAISGSGQDGPTDAELAERFQNTIRREREQPNFEMNAEQYAQYRNAFTAMLRRGDRVPEISNEMSVGSDSDGGYWCPPDMSGRIIEYIRETSPVRSVASVETTGRDALEGEYDLDEAGTGGWVSEQGTRDETDTPGIGEWRIPVHEQYAMPITTQRVLDDADRDVEGWLEGKVARKMSRFENDAFVNGDGVGKPRGFLTYAEGTPDPSSTATWEVIKQFASGDANGFAATDGGDVFIDMLYDLKPEYQVNAQWAMQRSVLAEVRKLKDGQGNYLWQLSFQDNNMAAEILGKSTVMFEDMPGYVADGLSVALADWSESYTIVDRQGIRILRDPFTTKGKVKFYTTKRVGGDVTNFDAIRLMKLATSL